MTSDGTSPVLTVPTFVGAVVAYWVLFTAYNFLTAPQPPTSIPWIGYGKGWVASLRNFLALTKSKEWLLAGYEKYSKNNKIFVLPATLGMYEVSFMRTWNANVDFV
jgi:hypothetical protein